MTVLEDGHVRPGALARAERYLSEHAVEATLVTERGRVGRAILDSVAGLRSELIIMGGYGFGPFLEIALGSTVDQVLRQAKQPVLICR